MPRKAEKFEDRLVKYFSVEAPLMVAQTTLGLLQSIVNRRAETPEGKVVDLTRSRAPKPAPTALRAPQQAQALQVPPTPQAPMPPPGRAPKKAPGAAKGVGHYKDVPLPGTDPGMPTGNLGGE
jgi:hypothetical protein